MNWSRNASLIDEFLDCLDDGRAVNAVHLHEDSSGTTACYLPDSQSADNNADPAASESTAHSLTKTTYRTNKISTDPTLDNKIKNCPLN